MISSFADGIKSVLRQSRRILCKVVIDKFLRLFGKATSIGMRRLQGLKGFDFALEIELHNVSCTVLSVLDMLLEYSNGNRMKKCISIQLSSGAK